MIFTIDTCICRDAWDCFLFTHNIMVFGLDTPVKEIGLLLAIPHRVIYLSCVCTCVCVRVCVCASRAVASRVTDLTLQQAVFAK